MRVLMLAAKPEYLLLLLVLPPTMSVSSAMHSFESCTTACSCRVTLIDSDSLQILHGERLFYKSMTIVIHHRIKLSKTKLPCKLCIKKMLFDNSKIVFLNSINVCNAQILLVNLIYFYG